MAIVKMNRFSLFAFKKHRKSLIEKFQSFKYIHFKDLNNKSEEFKNGLTNIDVSVRLSDIESRIIKANFLFKALKKYDMRPTGIAALKKGQESFSIDRLYSEASKFEFDLCFEEVEKTLKNIEEINQNINSLKLDIDTLKPWESLSVDLSNIKDIKTVDFIFGYIPLRFEEVLKETLIENEDVYFEKVSTSKGNAYYCVVILKNSNKNFEDDLRKIGFVNSEIEGNSRIIDILDSSNSEIKDYKSEINKLEESLKENAKKLREIEIYFEYLQNEKLKLSKNKNLLKTKNIVCFEGFIPVYKTSEFEKIINETLEDEYYLDLKEADKQDEDVPILLENGKFADSFSSITTMYSLPKYNEVDPTPLFAPFYWLFFGMMAADIGYGILLFIATFTAIKTFNLKDSMKQFIKFFMYLSVAITIWGFVYGSFFGGLIEMPFKLIDTGKDFTVLLILSIILGLINLFFGLAIKAYIYIRDGKYMEAVYDVLVWYLTLAGGILFLVGKMIDMPKIVSTISMWLMIIGMVGIVLFGGRASKSIGGRLATGLYELYGISGYIGDFVSFSRLMAIGLSGGFIGFAINMIVGMVTKTGGASYLVGALIFIPFHLFNMFLTMLSAYVHTSRLTYVEFFGKFFEGGGKLFDIFATQPKYLKIEKENK